MTFNINSEMISAIAVDDEFSSLEVIKRYADEIPFLNLKATFKDAKEALVFLEKEPVDLLFTDLDMPVMSGAELIKRIPTGIYSVLVTASTKATVNSLEVKCNEILFKPYSFKQFLLVCQKIKGFR